MDQRTNQILFALLRSAIYDKQASQDELSYYSDEILPQLIFIANKHDVIHLLAYGLKLNNITSKESDNNEVIRAIFRYERMNYEYLELCDILEKEQVPFIPLKGAIIRRYYRKAWMRTSCDIDILLHEDDVDRVANLLSEKYGYTQNGKTTHDISLYSESKVHIELHYTLTDDGSTEAATAVLQSVWQLSRLCSGCKYKHEMLDEMLYFHHIAHMAKHFEKGGCGIKPFIDLIILNNTENVTMQKRDLLLAKGDLLKFEKATRKLSNIWFFNADMDSVSQQMEDYVLRGGVYGSLENRVKIQRQKQGGRIRYILSRIFLPYKYLKFEYPCLIKHKWLTPLMEVRRWLRLVFGGRAGRAVHELKHSMSNSSDEIAMKEFLNNIGL